MPEAAPPPHLADRIETERLALLRPQPGDLDEFAAMLADKELGEWLGQSFDRAASAAALTRDIGHWDTHRFGLWIMRDRVSGELVGRGGLIHTIVAGSGAVEVGWAVKRERWGEGLATEMARTALGLAGEELGLDEVVSMTLPGNVASRRVMEKIGLRFDRDIDHRGLAHVLYRGPTGIAAASARTTAEAAAEDAIRYAAPDLARHDALRAMARRCFSDTWGHGYGYDPAQFAAFVDETFRADGPMAGDLTDPAIRWRVAFHGDEPVGYAKLTPLRAPAPQPLPGALELQHLYVLAEWQGRGVAARLTAWALATAAAAGAPELYLTVNERNERAKRFYRRYGFVHVGQCTFVIGDHVDDDQVWCLPLS